MLASVNRAQPTSYQCQKHMQLQTATIEQKDEWINTAGRSDEGPQLGRLWIGHEPKRPARIPEWFSSTDFSLGIKAARQWNERVLS